MEYKECNLKGFEGLYRIYENGDIYSLWKMRMLKPALNTNKHSEYAYLYVLLTGHNKKHLRTSVHQIVIHHWVSEKPGTQYECDHKDKNKLNNHYTNLQWVTHKDNILRARSINNWQSGRKNGFKASEETKQLMRIKKYKKVLLFNSTESIVCQSVEEAINKLSTNRKAINRYANTNKTYKGYKIKILGRNNY